VDFGYLFANHESILKAYTTVFLLSCTNLSLSGWTSGAAAGILEGTWLTTRGASRQSSLSFCAVTIAGQRPDRFAARH
jgi:hypothetical protein